MKRDLMTITRQIAVGILFGVLVAILGTTTHRAVIGAHDFPVGIIEAFALVGATAVWIRAWAGQLGLAIFGGALALVIVVLSSSGPGGNVMVTSQAISLAWAVGSLLVVAIGFFLPRSWFEDVPLRLPHRHSKTRDDDMRGH